DLAVEAMEVYAHFCAASGIPAEQVHAVATSAIRDASNGAALLARGGAATGLPAHVLSSEQEAYYGYLAAVDSTTLRDGAVLDLGGGSLQIVRVADRADRESGSWRLGTVLMSERFLPPNGPAKRKQLQELCDHVTAELDGAEWLDRAAIGEQARLVGIGGTVRNLAAAAQREAGLPSNGVQGMVIS